MKVANYFTFCINGGLIPNYFYIDDMVQAYVDAENPVKKDILYNVIN